MSSFQKLTCICPNDSKASSGGAEEDRVYPHRVASATPGTASAVPRTTSVVPRTASAVPRTASAVPQAAAAATRVAAATPPTAAVASNRGGHPGRGRGGAHHSGAHHSGAHQSGGASSCRGRGGAHQSARGRRGGAASGGSASSNGGRSGGAQSAKPAVAAASNHFALLEISDESSEQPIVATVVAQAPPSLTAIMASAEVEAKAEAQAKATSQSIAEAKAVAEAIALAAPIPRRGPLRFSQPGISDINTSNDSVPEKFRIAVSRTCLRGVMFRLKTRDQSRMEQAEQAEQSAQSELSALPALSKRAQETSEYYRKKNEENELCEQHRPPTKLPKLLDLAKLQELATQEAVQEPEVQPAPAVQSELVSGNPLDYKCSYDYHRGVYCCLTAHLNAPICNNFSRYLNNNWNSAKGISYRGAYDSCRNHLYGREPCNYWPCNLVDKVQFAIDMEAANARAQAAKAAAAKVAAEKIAILVDPSTFVPCAVVPDESCKLSAEKAEMQVSNPLLYAVWVCTHSNLPKAEFLELFHANYLAWNAVTTRTIRGAKVDEDDNEWDEQTAEVENADHRREFADYQAAVLNMPISEDPRVLGSKHTELIVHNNSEVFGEYIRAHWNFAGRPEVLGQVVTFHQWLNSHPSYSMIYRLFQNGQSWKDAKKALKGAQKCLATCETFNDWDSAESAVQTVSVADEAEEAAFAAKQKQLKALMQMTATDAVAEASTKPTQVQYGAHRERVKVFLPSKAPSFLKGTEQSDKVFVCRHSKGAFEIYIKLANKLNASVAANIAKTWVTLDPDDDRDTRDAAKEELARITRRLSESSVAREAASIIEVCERKKFRSLTGTKSFVTAGCEMFLRISGTIKKMNGFQGMFEYFPGFIAALQNEQFVANGGVCAVPVVMHKNDRSPYTYFASTENKQWLVEQTECTVDESNDESDDESVDESDDEFDDEFDDESNRCSLGGNIPVRAAVVPSQDADCGFAFAEESAEAADEPVSRYETDAYSLVDILVHYFKK